MLSAKCKYRNICKNPVRDVTDVKKRELKTGSVFDIMLGLVISPISK